MKFIDEIEVLATAGDGGRGCMSFLRERFRPRGGPDGGDGGTGGSVVLVVDGGLATLFDFKFQKHLRAKRGQHGKGRCRDGANGDDLVVRVPPGTIVTDLESKEQLADLTVPGSRLVVARGGRGGRGNQHFATPTRQAPRHAETGRPGEERRLRLELRLLAEVGLIGLPNAGKSTLLAAMSAARPRIAAYPFTTLVPHLGVVRREDEAFVMADIPGVIRGAHTGAGLGTRFLRHIARTSLLAHLLDASEQVEDDEEPFATVNEELARYDAELAAKPQVLVATKIDLPAARKRLPTLSALAARHGLELHAVSARSGEGLEKLRDRLFERVDELRRSTPPTSPGIPPLVELGKEAADHGSKQP